MKDKSTVIVIGLDGATFDLLKPWFAQGRLPALRKLYEEGVHGPLLSTLPPISPQAWTSFMTGKNPGKHGIFEFTEFEPKTYKIRFTNASSRYGKSLWKILSENGKRVGVINVPMTYPPEKVNGFLVAGFDAPGVHSTFTYPPDLYEKIDREVGKYDIHGDFWTTKGPEYYVKRTLETIDNHAQVTKYLMNKENLDFFMPVFCSTDKIQHFFWKYMDQSHPKHVPAERERYGDAVFRIYERVDKYIKEYLDSISGEKSVVIMSDHGAGPYYKVIYIDNWLEQEGFLSYRKAGNSLKQNASRSLLEITKSAYLQLRKYLPRDIKDWLKGKLPGMRHRIESHLILSNIDWTRTKAFSMGVETTMIYVNVKDRFPLGMVAPGKEYEDVRDAVISKLYKLRDPESQEPVVENVFKKEEIYHGECLDVAPDLIVIWRNYEYITRRHYAPEGLRNNAQIISSELKVGEVGELMSLEQTGSHRPDGIAIFWGQGVKRSKAIEGARIIDLAPTLLYMLGVPVPDDMDGTVLLDVFDKDYIQAHPVSRSKRAAEEHPEDGRGIYSEAEAQLIEKRLKDLGYL